MAQLFTNNASATLASGITATATSCTVASGKGALFPSPSNGDYAILTLTQAGSTETSWEEVCLTARSGDVLTFDRAYEGSTALAWASGSKVELRITAEGIMYGALGSFGGGSAISTGVYNANLALDKARAIQQHRRPKQIAGTYTLTDDDGFPQHDEYVSDAGRVLLIQTAGTSIVIPDISTLGFDVGTCITIINATPYFGTASVSATVAQLMLAGASDPGVRTLGGRSINRLVYIGTSGVTQQWLIDGTGIT